MLLPALDPARGVVPQACSGPAAVAVSKVRCPLGVRRTMVEEGVLGAYQARWSIRWERCARRW